MAEEREHRTELRERVEYRYNESHCIEPGCEYYDKPAVQGHCHTRLDDETDRFIDRIERLAEESLAFYRERHQGDEYVKALEAMYVCAWMNVESTTDMLIRLRRENAALKIKAPEEMCGPR